MEFNPHNPIIQLCLLGMEKEAKGNSEEAGTIFNMAWNEAKDDFEKFLAAHFVARQQKNPRDKILWLEKMLHYANMINDDSVTAAYPGIYMNLANCYRELHEEQNTIKYEKLAQKYTHAPSDKGPFYHGTKADLKTGDVLTPGFRSNYQSDMIMNHIYFTALLNGAGLAAALAKGDGPERVYMVEPNGEFEHDPNVTDKKFPGNPTRSYRTLAPLKITGEVTDWQKQTSDQVQKWKEKLANNKGDIIN